VQHIRGAIDWLIAVHHFTIVVHKDEITHANVSETHAKGIHPKVVGELWVTNRDVSGNSFAETKTTKNAKRAGEFVLTFAALVFYIPAVSNVERLWERETTKRGLFGCEFDTVNAAHCCAGGWSIWSNCHSASVGQFLIVVLTIRHGTFFGQHCGENGTDRHG
jgi:hypothetical protein